MDNLEHEKEQLSQAVKTNALLADLMQRQNRENVRLWVSQIISWVIIVALIGCVVWQNSHMQETVSQAIADSQAVFNEALTEAFNTIAEMEVTSDTTTTTTVEGDHAVYNDVAGDQFNDSAQQQNGGAE